MCHLALLGCGMTVWCVAGCVGRPSAEEDRYFEHRLSGVMEENCELPLLCGEGGYGSYDKEQAGSSVDESTSLESSILRMQQEGHEMGSSEYCNSMSMVGQALGDMSIDSGDVLDNSCSSDIERHFAEEQWLEDAEWRTAGCMLQQVSEGLKQIHNVWVSSQANGLQEQLDVVMGAAMELQAVYEARLQSCNYQFLKPVTKQLQEVNAVCNEVGSCNAIVLKALEDGDAAVGGLVVTEYAQGNDKLGMRKEMAKSVLPSVMQTVQAVSSMGAALQRAGHAVRTALAVVDMLRGVDGCGDSDLSRTTLDELFVALKELLSRQQVVAMLVETDANRDSLASLAGTPSVWGMWSIISFKN